MKKNIFLFFITLFIFSECQAQRKKDYNDSWDGNFDIVFMPEVKTIPNVVTLKATAIGKTREEATGKSKRNAVAAILFKGVPGSAVSSPLLGSEVNYLHDKYKSFFDEFFAPKGDFNRFVNLPGSVDPQDIIAIKKIGFEVAAACQVNYLELRYYMEEKGIIKKLGL